MWREDRKQPETQRLAATRQSKDFQENNNLAHIYDQVVIIVNIPAQKSIFCILISLWNKLNVCGFFLHFISKKLCKKVSIMSWSVPQLANIQYSYLEP